LDALIAAILVSPKVRDAVRELTRDAGDASKRALICWLKPTVRERAAKEAIRIFCAKWNVEMEPTAFRAAYEGYRNQLHKLVEVTATEIAE
jgi:hypothetical protein